MSYTWKINQLERNTADGGVTVAHWTCSYTVEDNTVSAYGTVGFQPDPEAADFISFDSLTEDTVLGWVFYSTDGFRKDTETSLSNQMNELLNPVTEAGVPWNVPAND